MPEIKRVLISGGSIAGPALAYWLNQYGFEVTIVERAPALRQGGFSVDIRGAALGVLDRMGILERVREADTRMTGVYFVNGRGRVKGTIRGASLGNRQGVDIEILRDDLIRFLYQLTKDTITYQWGDTITAIRETEDGVEVQFARSGPQIYDVVIGADGLHSHVRSLIFGEESQYKHSLGCYLTIFSTPHDSVRDHSLQLYTLPGRSVGIYSLGARTPAKGAFVFKSGQIPYDRHDPPAQKELVMKAFRDLQGWETQRLLQAMKASDDFYFDEVCQIRMPGWSKGRVALVGDAAYGPSPLSGQGTSLALVGAYILAGELRASNGSYAAAFAAYEQAMRAFVEKNQKIALVAAEGLVETSGFKIWIRNTMIRVPFLPALLLKMVTNKITKASNGIELQAYR